MTVIPAQAGIQKFGFTVIFKYFWNAGVWIPACVGMTAVGSVLYAKEHNKGRLKIGIAESAKSFSDDLFFKAESNQPAG